VKVLDFGLARVTTASAVHSEDSPTISMAATQAGVILGTAAHMAREQARGKVVDKRADVWAFSAAGSARRIFLQMERRYCLTTASSIQACFRLLLALPTRSQNP
jgi:serine/threonine-protein kinase